MFAPGPALALAAPARQPGRGLGLAGHTLARWRTAQTGLKIIGISLAMVSCQGARGGQEVRTGQVADSLHLAVMLYRGHNLLE